jgi:hypothetical protein
MGRGVLGMGIEDGWRATWGVLLGLQDELFNDSTLWSRRAAKTLTRERANV